MSCDYLEIECRGYPLRHWLTESNVPRSAQGRTAWALTHICLAYNKLRGPLLTSFGLEMLNSLLFSYLPAFKNLDQEFLLQYYSLTAGTYGHVNIHATFASHLEPVLLRFEQGTSPPSLFSLEDADGMVLPPPFIAEEELMIANAND